MENLIEKVTGSPQFDVNKMYHF